MKIEYYIVCLHSVRPTPPKDHNHAKATHYQIQRRDDGRQANGIYRGCGRIFMEGHGNRKELWPIDL
jgi:hypothetical protein